MSDVVHEIYSVARAKGVAVDPPSPNGYMDLFYDKLLPPTPTHYASMREDLRQGRRTEIDALNGAIARYGEGLAIRTPANTLLARLVRAKEAKECEDSV